MDAALLPSHCGMLALSGMHCGSSQPEGICLSHARLVDRPNVCDAGTSLMLVATPMQAEYATAKVVTRRTEMFWQISRSLEKLRSARTFALSNQPPGCAGMGAWQQTRFWQLIPYCIIGDHPAQALLCLQALGSQHRSLSGQGVRAYRQRYLAMCPTW